VELSILLWDSTLPSGMKFHASGMMPFNSPLRFYFQQKPMDGAKRLSILLWDSTGRGRECSSSALSLVFQFSFEILLDLSEEFQKLAKAFNSPLRFYKAAAIGSALGAVFFQFSFEILQ